MASAGAVASRRLEGLNPVHRNVVAVVACALAAVVWSGSRPPEIPFEKAAIDLGASETCAFADVNGDGRLDIVSGD